MNEGSNPSGAWKGSANSRYFSVISPLGKRYAVFPARRSALHSAAALPSVSPSGFLCVSRRKRSFVRNSFAVSLILILLNPVVFDLEAVDDLVDMGAVFDAVVDLEDQLGRIAQFHGIAELAAQIARSRA